MFDGDETAFRESTAAARVNGYVAGDGTRVQLAREIDFLGLSENSRARLIARVRTRPSGIGCSVLWNRWTCALMVGPHDEDDWPLPRAAGRRLGVHSRQGSSVHGEA